MRPNAIGSIKKYLRSVAEDFPHAFAEGYHVFGWRGMYLAACAFVLRRQPFAVAINPFGTVKSWREALNIIDNFACGELRSDRVERHLRRGERAWIIDVGVNIGVTCRWWLSLSESIDVIGVDMFGEALDFASARIAARGFSNRWHPITAAVADSEGTAEVSYSDPLEGTSALDSTTGATSRTVRVSTLDALIAQTGAERFALLKLDIEGYAGRALLGAPKTLSVCDYVVVETHSEDETLTASNVLTRAGFQLFLCRGRTMWWQAGSIS